MALHVALNHKSLYDYDRHVQMGPQVIRLRPAPHGRTPILSYALDVRPAGYFLNWQQDPHGNFMARIVHPEPVPCFHVEVDLVADMVVFNPFDFFLEPDAETWPFEYEGGVRRDLEPYLQLEPLTPLLEEWLAAVPRIDEIPTVDFIIELNRRIQQQIRYVVRLESGFQTPEQTLEYGSGSCRDSAWLLAQILRRLGIASRFVSGYLIQLVPDVESLDGPSGASHDFTDLHAWTEAYLPGAGWVGLDPTSGLLAGEGHIPLASTPHPSSAAPISGSIGECRTEFRHEMSVARTRETPRVTKPYSEAQWRAIDAFGHVLSRRLGENDVRLTVGGEPTFVSLDDPDAPEWNTSATGPTKRERADTLIRRLKARFAPQGGLLHFGQGKWYPGEQLPRWAFSLYWRRDEKPLWSDSDLIAHETSNLAPTAELAERFLRGVADRLELAGDAVVPAYEDPWHFIAAERRLPENVDAADNRLDDPLARERVARVFERGLETPAGYVLPLQRWNARDGSPRWATARWTTRTGRLYLTPGDSPVGYRLPLASLPYIRPIEYPYIVPADPTAERPELGEPDRRRQPFRWRRLAAEGEAPQTLTAQAPITADADAPVRAALTAEPRDGRLCVFMPPVAELEDYIELVAAIEDTAAELASPLHIGGYDPPTDSRLNVIRVTPDPGVVEVNVHPASSWDEMRAITEGIYEDARLSRLSTDKFMLDGRHVGTGGGNHVVLGGPTPTDSPFLRRPDLLRSLITYWQNHPALSYLFSGLFIGPTSQAPRIDEARHDQLNELELAFTQIGGPGSPAPPWLVDRIFRNLLVDVTGNTHRSEICIDKLYSPEGPTGRLGLVEFRAFEMPPHPRMSLAQQLLLLALVARFWEQPYTARLVRWGTRLHDRFMLPEFVHEDLRDVVDDMRRHGFALEPEWFEPHFEFRFPEYGRVQFRGIELELKHALEPWHVLGEQGAVGGTARYVDSSVERVQIKVRGIDEARYTLGCNGKRVPLVPTARSGELVGGVRFRAWRPPESLHPTIPVDAPLVFDLHDSWTGRAVAGCTYHVAHPGGRNFERFPVNAYEAESRRLARFSSIGHSPGPAPEPEALARGEMPCTLDLRWAHGMDRGV